MPSHAPRLLLFPKFFPDLDARGLAAVAREAGVDGVNPMLRDGHQPPDMLPEWVEAVRGEGLRVEYASCQRSAAELVRDPSALDLLADLKIAQVRIRWFFRVDGEPPAVTLDRAAGELAALADACLERGLRAVVQQHHGTLLPSCQAIWPLVRSLSAAAVGVKLDPGNGFFEGREDPRLAMDLIGPRLAAVGVKDAAADGFRPLGEGQVDWAKVIDAVGDFTGPWVLMPFVEDKDPKQQVIDDARMLRGWLDGR